VVTLFLEKIQRKFNGEKTDFSTDNNRQFRYPHVNKDLGAKPQTRSKNYLKMDQRLK
jgi:hypothetical protein